MQWIISVRPTITSKDEINSFEIFFLHFEGPFRRGRLPLKQAVVHYGFSKFQFFQILAHFVWATLLFGTSTELACATMGNLRETETDNYVGCDYCAEGTKICPHYCWIHIASCQFGNLIRIFWLTFFSRPAFGASFFFWRSDFQLNYHSS